MTKSDLYRTVGILGGMGAEAGVELARRIIVASGARIDQEQVPCILITNPTMPDRPTFLEGRGPDPYPEMERTLRMLVAAGAELIAVPCNTAHVWYDRWCASAGVPVAHMIRAMVRKQAEAPCRAVGVLCTRATVNGGVYQACCAEAGIEALMSTEDELSDLVLKAIYGDLEAGLVGLKGSNKSRPIVDLMLEASRRLIDRGAEAIWLACTEISLVRDELATALPVPVADALDVLADEVVRLARR